MGVRSPSRNFPYLFANNYEFHEAWNDFLLSQEQWLHGRAFISVDSLGEKNKGTASSGSMLAGYVSVAQKLLHYTATLTGITMHIDAGTGSTDVKPVVYGDDGTGFPGALVASGAEDQWSAPLKTFTISPSVTLYPGVYWIGFHAEGNLTMPMLLVWPLHQSRYNDSVYLSGVPDPYPTVTPSVSTHRYPIYGNLTPISSNITVDDNAANAKVIEVSGVMTQNMTMTMPDRTSVFILDNRTTGDFSLIVKTASGTGTQVAQGDGAAFLYNDGSDVYPIDGAAGTKVNYPILASDSFSLGLIESTGTIV